MNIEKISISKRPNSEREEIIKGTLDYYESVKGEELESGEKIKEVAITRKQVQDIGNIFSGTYIMAFTKAVAEGKTFKDADKLAMDKCREEKVDTSFYSSGYVVGNVMTYTSCSGNMYVLIQDDNENYRFIYPDNSVVANNLDGFTQKQ